MSNVATGGRWLKTFHPAPDDAPRLVCFPHAGGSAGWFSRLGAELAGEVRLSAVQYPGRLDRLRDGLVDDLCVLAELVSGALDVEDGRPVSLFGHSMGAVVAFEVARRLRAASVPVAHLFVSGRVAPHLRRDRDVHLLTDDGLVETMEHLGGVRPGSLRDADLRALVLPVVRNDYRAIETYRCEQAPPLSCPITALTGDDDPITGVADAREWAVHTDAGFTLEVFPGGHFFPLQRWGSVAEVVRRGLRGTA
ncbi:Surfactin synthase thioesterase subunit [Lentzea fradiae]|uniref:Surfactin synthase thioesterase subunit n=1 Tax=Lentzea fradiae TaxID=200378 RepID=A0A1G8CME4_9PSEU|nr:alpha/beta fold hydrolase [Lentzea fradiae]SDH46576.1 Surfactin synthase thioesterase subunit [Lentzea fradiae]